MTAVEWTIIAITSTVGSSATVSTFSSTKRYGPHGDVLQFLRFSSTVGSGATVVAFSRRVLRLH